MLAAQRRDALMAALARDGRIVAKDQATALGVSEDSIRRDLRDLAAEGRCQRVYGGALPVSPAIVDYAGRRSVSVEGKALVAAAAAELVDEGSTIIIDGGTTALALAGALPRDRAFTVITHSPTVATALVEHPSAAVFLLGGALFKHSAVTCGAATVEAASRISADLFFLGVTGVHPEAGLTTGDAEEAAMKRVLVGRAAETYVLGSAEKLGAASPYSIVSFGQVAGIITDSTDEDLLADLRRRTRVIGVDG